MADVIVRLKQVSPATTEGTIRRHTILVDRPEAKGGTDQGPMGGEYFLASMGGCFMSTLLAAIRTRNAVVSNVRAEVIGTLVDSPARFTSAELLVSADYEDPELFAKLVQVAESGCIMVNTLKGKFDLSVRIVSPTAHTAATS